MLKADLQSKKKSIDRCGLWEVIKSGGLCDQGLLWFGPFKKGSCVEDWSPAIGAIERIKRILTHQWTIDKFIADEGSRSPGICL
jgi:hypothetical protein